MVLGRDVQGLGFAEMRPMRKAMQIVFQDPYGSLSPRMSVADIVAEGLYIQEPGLKEGAARERVARALIDVGLDPAAMDRYPHEFSGGSASASPLLAPWRSIRNSWCSMSPPPHSI